MKTTTIPPLRIAILGCANIAQQFAIAVVPGKWVRIEAMGNRKADTAAAFAVAYGIARHYGSYQALPADPGINTVYTPLPNALHAQ